MAGLINARAIVTTTGHLTEPVWAETGAVALAAARDTDALVPPRGPCSPKTTTGPHSPRAARGPIASGLRSRTRSSALRGAVEGAAA